MKAELICYTLGKSTDKERSKFKRELFGYRDKSNKGKYKYKRSGILDLIPHMKPIRSVLIVEKENSKKVLNFLSKYNATVKNFPVEIEKNEFCTSSSDTK